MRSQFFAFAAATLYFASDRESVAGPPVPTIDNLSTATGHALSFQDGFSGVPASVGETLIFQAGSTQLEPGDTITSYTWASVEQGITIGSSPGLFLTVQPFTLDAMVHTIRLRVATTQYPGGGSVDKQIAIIDDQLYCGHTLEEWRDGPATIFVYLSFVAGSCGDDLIIGTSGSDLLDGEDPGCVFTSGDDCIYGLSGDDTLRGDPGDDELHGGDGVDHLYGDTGNDVLYGGRGGDFLFGDTGADTIHGGPDGDELVGDTGSDTIYGGGGDDVINGDADHDTIYAGPGNDFVEGDSGDDTLCGQQGSDYLDGEGNSDHLDGGEANDECRGGNLAQDICLSCETVNGCEAVNGTTVCPICGNGTLEAGETCDPPSSNVCSPACESLGSCSLSGTALGGAITLSVAGVALHLVTISPTSAAAVRQQLVDLLNNNQHLAERGITAYVDGESVIVVGAGCDYISLTDPGLLPCHTSDLLLHLTFDDSSNRGLDSSVHGNHGSLGTATIAPGVIHEALQMVGNNNQTEFHVVAPQLGLVTEMTGIAWVRPSGQHTPDSNPPNCTDGTVFTKGGNYWFQIRQDNDHLLLQNTYSGADYAEVATSMSQTGWSQIAFVRNVDNSVSFYKNGALIGTGALSELPAVNGEPFTVGDAFAGAPGACEFSGGIDEVKIYRCALGPDQIRQQFEIVRAQATGPISPIPTASAWGLGVFVLLLMAAGTVLLPSGARHKEAAQH